MQPKYAVIPEAVDKEASSALDPDTKRFVVSSDSLDSDKDIVLQDFDVKYFKKNPVMLPFHMRRELPIGKWTRIWTEKVPDEVNDLGEQKKITKGNAKFISGDIYPYAAMVKQFYDEGLMSAVSIGFQPIKFREISEELRQKLGMGFWSAVFEKSALKEISAVDIGSNPDALEERRSKMLKACIEEGFVDKSAENIKMGRCVLAFPEVAKKRSKANEVNEWLKGIETEFDLDEEDMKVLMDSEIVSPEKVAETLRSPDLDTKEITAALDSLAVKLGDMEKVVDTLTIKMREQITARKEDAELNDELLHALSLPETESFAQQVLKAYNG